MHGQFIRQLAKLNIDRSGELTADGVLVVFHMLYVLLSSLE